MESVVNIFAGQPFNDHFTYRRDVEVKRDVTNWMLSDEELSMGFANARVMLDYGQILTNMIINIQAFNSTFNESKENSVSKIINSERDDFGSRKPIDVIAANRPIVIMDEPQKMGGQATQDGIKRFNPLFCLNYSATHKQHHELVYVRIFMIVLPRLQLNTSSARPLF